MNQDVRRKLDKCLTTLLDRDRELLELDVNERSLAHKLAEYLQCEFPDWNVDCEYNRKFSIPKRLQGHPFTTSDVPTDDTSGRTVYPDIIVHRRGVDDNHLVVEIKKRSNRDDLEIDRGKLEGFTHQMGYRNAALIVFDGVEEPKIEDFSLE